MPLPQPGRDPDIFMQFVILQQIMSGQDLCYDQDRNTLACVMDSAKG